MKRIVLLMLTIIILLLSLASCSSPNTIEVTSKDYPKLTKMSPGQFDMSLYNTSMSGDYPWRNYYCYVSVEDGELCVSNKKDDLSDTKSAMFNRGYLVGTDFGEFSGWVRWFLQENLIYPEGKEPTVTETLLSDSNCRFIIEHIKGEDTALVVLDTVIMLSGEPNETVVYEFKEVRDASGYDYSIEFNELASFDGDCNAYLLCEDDRCVYFATDQGITKMAFDGTVEIVVKHDAFKYMLGGVTSIALYEGDFYCGSHFGIYRFDPDSGKSYWYPMDYEKYAE